MAITQPILAGQTLIHPTRYREILNYRGRSREMADGSLVFDLVNTSVKREFILEWDALTEAQQTILISVYDSIKSASAAFTSPDGTAYTVMRGPDAELEFEFYRVAGAVYRFRSRLHLREV